MFDQMKLKKEICLGKLIWMQAPSSFGSALFFTKKLLNNADIKDGEMVYLTAQQFSRYADAGFSAAFLKTIRVMLIGELEDLSQNAKREFLKKLSLYKILKLRFDINLVLISPPLLDSSISFLEQFHPTVFRVFELDDPVSINEKIHEMIEGASAEALKSIWRLSLDAAVDLESEYLKRGEDYVRRLIGRAVSYSMNKCLELKDIDQARKYIRFFETDQTSI